jgi:hypothetical protein
MKTTTDMCQLPGKYGYKYPKLGELYYHLFRKKPSEKLHNALEDVKVTKKCFEKLMTRHKDLKWKTVCRKPKVQIKRPVKAAKTK